MWSLVLRRALDLWSYLMFPGVFASCGDLGENSACGHWRKLQPREAERLAQGYGMHGDAGFVVPELPLLTVYTWYFPFLAHFCLPKSSPVGPCSYPCGSGDDPQSGSGFTLLTALGAPPWQAVLACSAESPAWLPFLQVSLSFMSHSRLRRNSYQSRKFGLQI